MWFKQVVMGAAFWLLLSLSSFGLGADLFSGQGANSSDYLPVDEAFSLEVDSRADQQTLVLRWTIAEGYYLYRRQLSFDPDEGEGVQVGQPRLPTGTSHSDEFFGEQEVYREQVTATLPVAGEPGATYTIQVGYQGCADAGLCYPPQHVTLDLSLPDAAPATLDDAAIDTEATTSAVANGGRQAAVETDVVSEQDQLARLISEGRLAWVLLAFTGFGLLLAFTPCVLPMVPILSSIIVGQKNSSTRHAFLLSLVYVLAMALTYTAAGVVAGLLGANLQIMFQNPWVLTAFALLFAVLALSMFGLFELQMPLAVQERLGLLSDRQKGGTLGGVAVMGLLSALVVGPCVAAPMAGALMVIGQSGDPLRGGLALFALSIGMGLPLIALGMGVGKFMPRAGAWMKAVKGFFGVLLLAVALYLLGRVLPATISVALWALLATISAVYLGAFAVPANGWHKAGKGLGLFVFSWGLVLLIGLASGRADLLTPLKAFADGASAQEEQLSFRQIKRTADLEREVALAAEAGQPVMLDFYADWCIICKEMERYTFTDSEVRQALEKIVLLQADVTANDREDRALLDRFGLYGPPGIIFFNQHGEELKSRQLVGFLDADDFLAHLERMR